MKITYLTGLLGKWANSMLGRCSEMERVIYVGSRMRVTYGTSLCVSQAVLHCHFLPPLFWRQRSLGLDPHTSLIPLHLWRGLQEYHNFLFSRRTQFWWATSQRDTHTGATFPLETGHTTSTDARNEISADAFSTLAALRKPPWGGRAEGDTGWFVHCVNNWDSEH